ncbi:MAG: hypothetical protein U0791_09975 [Gemmataceae bacterium]
MDFWSEAVQYASECGTPRAESLARMALEIRLLELENLELRHQLAAMRREVRR